MTNLPVASPKHSAPSPKRAAPLVVDVAAAPERPPYLIAALVALGTLLLYVVTLAPTTQFWDTSEYIAAAKVLGIPHPPGNPLFTLVAHVFGMIPWAANYGVRINVFAAITSALAAGCWFLIGERFMRNIVPATWPRRLAAIAGALCAATAFTVWNQSVVNEKVYTFSLLFIALILWFILRWDDQPAGTGHDHYLLLIVYLLALSSTNHMMGVLVGTVVVVLLFPPFKGERHATPEEERVEWTQFYVFTAVYGLIVSTGLESWKPFAIASLVYVGALLYAWWHANNWRFALLALGVAVLGLSVIVFLPIRAAHYPPINEGEPTTWNALYDVLTRGQYGKPPITQRQASFFAQLFMWGQYFSWQWGRDLAQRWQALLGVLFAFLGLLGAWRHWIADRRRAMAMTLMMVVFTLILIFYLNFKYGYSQYLDKPQLLREVRERDYFFIASFALWGVWVGIGLATLMEWVQDALRAAIPDTVRRWAMATPVLVLGLVPLYTNHLTASRAHETLARDFAADLLNSVEPYGILVTAGDNDTFPLWYAQEVESIRPDVTVVNLSLANTDWYVRQLQRRPAAPYDAAKGPPIYRNGSWQQPTWPLLNWPMSFIDSLPQYYPLNQRTSMNLGGVNVTLDPQMLGREWIERADIVVLEAIKDNIGRRPIYFSRTVGLYADQFGLTGYLEGHGFARKLHNQPITPSDSILPVGQLGYVNVARSTALLFDVYHTGTVARVRPRGWVDRPSEGILQTYGLMYTALSEAVRPKNPALASRALVLADSIFKNTSLSFQPPGEVR
jgi:Protein of unknown function (DUF2723)